MKTFFSLNSMARNLFSLSSDAQSMWAYVMDVLKRGQRKFRSLPRSLASAIRSLSSERLDNRPSLRKRRNGVSVHSYNELRKLILQKPLPTTVLRRSPTKEFPLNGNAFLLASSSYYILILTNDCSTLILLNEDTELYRLDLSACLILVNDLCWSGSFNRFYLAGYSMYTFNPSTYHLSLVKEIQLHRGEWIVSIAVERTSLYLLYSSSRARLERRSLLSEYQMEKRWSEKEFLRANDFLAQCIRINEWNILALTIKQRNGQWRVDLFNCQTLKRISQCLLTDQFIPGMRTCLLLPYERLWMIINNCTFPKTILLIDENGQMKEKLSTELSDGLINLCLLDKQWIGMICKDALRLYFLE